MALSFVEGKGKVGLIEMEEVLAAAWKEREISMAYDNLAVILHSRAHKEKAGKLWGGR